MKSTHDSKLCNRLIRIAIENRSMPREEYLSRIGAETLAEYTPVAVYSALTYLCNHGVITLYKNLIGLSNPQLATASFWLNVDDVLQGAEGPANASRKGLVQSSSGQP